MNLQEIATKEYVDLRIESIYKEVRAILEEQYMFPTGYCTRKQALHMLGCSRRSLYNYVNQNLIGYVGSGQGMRFFVADIKRYLQAHHVKAEVLERRLKEASRI